MPDDYFIYYYPYNVSYAGGQFSIADRTMMRIPNGECPSTGDYIHITKADGEIYKLRSGWLKFRHFGSDPVQYTLDGFIQYAPIKEEGGTVQCFFPPADEQGKSYLDTSAQYLTPKVNNYRRHILEKESGDTLPVSTLLAVVVSLSCYARSCHLVSEQVQ